VSVHDIGEQPQAMAILDGGWLARRRRRGIRSSHNQSPERPFSLLMLLDLLTGKLDDAARRTNQQLT
jgi:hypothetical protein